MAISQQEHLRELSKGYRFGWSDPAHYVFKPKKGLSEEVVEEISFMKSEPQWMRKFRLKALKHFQEPAHAVVGRRSVRHRLQRHLLLHPVHREASPVLDDLPDDIRSTWDKLGIPEAEKKYLGGVSAQYESEVVYHKIKEELDQMGVLFSDMDTALRDHPDIVKEYFGTIIPPDDNKFAALNSAVWSADRSSTFRRACRSISRSRPTSGSMPRTWVSSSGR